MKHSYRRFALAFVGPALLLVGCASSGDQNSAPAPPDGYTALFDGQTLDGWRPFVASPPDLKKMGGSEYAQELKNAYERMKEHWKVEDGQIITDGQGQNLCTLRNYKDFELYVDWKIEPGGDSGIYLRDTPQVQIWDRTDVGSGGLYNNEKNPSNPLVIADNQPGQWNTFRITMIGDRVTVFLNDALVVDNVVLENCWDRAKPIHPAGAIELQAHGNTVRFRNIFIHELP